MNFYVLCVSETREISLVKEEHLDKLATRTETAPSGLLWPETEALGALLVHFQAARRSQLSHINIV